MSGLYIVDAYAAYRICPDSPMWAGKWSANTFFESVMTTCT